MWIRENSFGTLVLTILEQQVSLASAYAANQKLLSRLGEITPLNVLRLSDEELRNCSFTRQKIVYVRELARALVQERINLDHLQTLDDEEVRTILKALKGIGDWTVDIYLIHALRRMDIFPVGDLALVNAMKEVKRLSPDTSKEELLRLSVVWKPFRSVATMILWHHYIQKRKLKLIA
jgi:DNA-3-methyladenine glycosylase II